VLLEGQRGIVEASQGQWRRNVLPVQSCSVHLLTDCHLVLKLFVI